MENKYQTALDNVKNAPSFMGGNIRYNTVLESSIPFLEDIAVLQELVDKEKSTNKKGYWKIGVVDDDGQIIHICSHCGDIATYDGLHWEWLTQYCPWCGAKMSHKENKDGTIEKIDQCDEEEIENTI